MPDGTDAVVEARLGYTVEHVKALLHERFGLPIAQQVRAKRLQEHCCKASVRTLSALLHGLQRLTCEGRPMIDPLSLSDCTGIKQGAPNLIDVKVRLLMLNHTRPTAVSAICQVHDAAGGPLSTFSDHGFVTGTARHSN